MARTRGMRRAAPAALALALLIVSTTVVIGKNFSSWGDATLIAGDVNTTDPEGCPIESSDGLSLYIASSRDGDPNDIYVAHRSSTDAPWSEPERLPAPANSAAADFCPTPLNGNYLLFVSNRAVSGACGAGDMYLTRKHPVRGWEEPVNLGCNPSGPNTSGAEFSPSLVETDEGIELYFSTGVPNVPGTQDIYVSRQRPDGTFGPGERVAGVNLNLPTHDDQMPNVSRDGLEMVFASNRPGGAGSFDVYTTHRATTSEPWSEPVNVGRSVNTDRPETRPSLSGDRQRLHFGRPHVLGGPADIWVSTRLKLTGGE